MVDDFFLIGALSSARTDLYSQKLIGIFGLFVNNPLVFLKEI